MVKLTEDDLFMKMFKHAEKCALEDFTDEEVLAEGIEIDESKVDEVAVEGFVKAIVGDAVRNVTDAWKEMKGWFLGIESKKNYIDESCKDTIQWLKEEDQDNPKLSLDLGKFKTWMKTSETFYWRYYFVLHDETYNDIMKSIKNNEISSLEVYTDFNIKERMKVAQNLDSMETIKDLIVVVEKYRSRCVSIFDGLMKRKRRIQSFPFQIMLLGYADLNRTVKKIVNLAS